MFIYFYLIVNKTYNNLKKNNLWKSMQHFSNKGNFNKQLIIFFSLFGVIVFTLHIMKNIKNEYY